MPAFARGIINLDSLSDGDYALLNPGEMAIDAAYKAYSASGEIVREGTFTIEAYANVTGTLSELLEEDLAGVSYAVLEADGELHGYVRSNKPDFVTVLPIIGY